MVHIRQAQPDDADGISVFLKKLTAIGQRSLPDTADYVLGRYIDHPDVLSCCLAVSEGGTPLGLQVLVRASAGNEYGLTQGWGIVGTHIDPDAARQGIGKALFTQTRETARLNGLRFLDAAIGDQNAGGLAYYERIGFETYATEPGRVRKRYDVSA
ncbi:GNAT family N-acetyltransferase [uncultured Pelagimonas sp.]|uniref:GNAT family N-acetyltransferase n=1 Tax=uncultured Pelagimonas sp. TaxID=1618102 RepID=UPI0026276FC7|nr:GNAT family N-acetyltransferase [uncultured Pelagimonas sp.]